MGVGLHTLMMMTPAWTLELRTALRDQGGPPLATLATVAGTSAEARTVVVREVGDDGSLTFTSDARSDKNTQLRANPSATLLFWLPTPKRQFRLAGTVDILPPADPRRQHQWERLNDGARALFLWPPPGEPREDKAPFPPKASTETPVPASFEVLVLSPARVEVLDLGQLPHLRQRWTARLGEWVPLTVNP